MGSDATGARIRRGIIGGSVTIKGGQPWEPILSVVNVTAGDPVTRELGEADSDSHTIFSAFMVTDTRNPQLPPARVLLLIEVGDGNDGGAALVRRICLAGRPIQVAGSVVRVFARLFLDEVGAQLAPPTVSAQVKVYAGVGEGEDIQPTIWPTPAANLTFAQQVTTGPSSFRAIQGFSASAGGVPLPGGATGTYLMFFDWNNNNTNPPNGTSPLPGMAWPVPIGAVFSDDYIESAKLVTYGLRWCCSSTGDVLTLDVAQLLRVDVEQYAQDQIIPRET